MKMDEWMDAEKCALEGWTKRNSENDECGSFWVEV